MPFDGVFHGNAVSIPRIYAHPNAPDLGAGFSFALSNFYTAAQAPQVLAQYQTQPALGGVNRLGPDGESFSVAETILTVPGNFIAVDGDSDGDDGAQTFFKSTVLYWPEHFDAANIFLYYYVTTSSGTQMDLQVTLDDTSAQVTGSLTLELESQDDVQDLTGTVGFASVSDARSLTFAAVGLDSGLTLGQGIEVTCSVNLTPITDSLVGFIPLAVYVVGVSVG